MLQMHSVKLRLPEAKKTPLHPPAPGAGQKVIARSGSILCSLTPDPVLFLLCCPPEPSSSPSFYKGSPNELMGSQNLETSTVLCAKKPSLCFFLIAGVNENGLQLKSGSKTLSQGQGIQGESPLILMEEESWGAKELQNFSDGAWLAPSRHLPACQTTALGLPTVPITP